MRKPLVGLLVGFLLVLAMLFVLGARDIVAVVRTANPVVVAASVLIGVGSVIGYGEAFRHLRGGLEPTPTGTRFHAAYYSAYFVKLSLPVGAASFPAVLAYVMAYESDTSFEQDFAVATAADLLRYTTSFLLALVGLALFLLTGGGTENGPVVAAAVGAGVVFIVSITTFSVLLFWPELVDRFVLTLAALTRTTLGRLSDRVRLAVRREAIEERLALFHATIGLLRTARQGVVAATTLTAFSVVLLVTPLWLSFAALGTWVPFALVLFAVPAGNLMGVFPLPGGLGGVELALGAVVVAAADVSVATAAAAVLLHRLATYWVPLFVGGVTSLFVTIETRWATP